LRGSRRRSTRRYIVAGLVGEPLDVAEFSRLGVRRISIGGSLARAGLGLVGRAAQEMLDGRFDFTAGAIAHEEVNRMMARCDDPGGRLES
jgi:2-methylisocitrate lyase-like PEP mutase family enzyme